MNFKHLNIIIFFLFLTILFIDSVIEDQIFITQDLMKAQCIALQGKWTKTITATFSGYTTNYTCKN